MGSLHWCQSFPCSWELESQALELFEMEGRQCFEPLGTGLCKTKPDDTMVLVISDPSDQTNGLCAIDETDRAVVTKEQVVGHLPDGRPPRVTVPAHGQHELMLGGCQTCGSSLLFAPSLEATQACP